MMRSIQIIAKEIGVMINKTEIFQPERALSDYIFAT